MIMTSTRSRGPRNPGNSWAGGNVPMHQGYRHPSQALIHNPAANFTGQQRAPLLQQPGLQPHPQILPVMQHHIPMTQQMPPGNYRFPQQVPVYPNPTGSLMAGQPQSMPGMAPSYFPRQHIFIHQQQVRGTPRIPQQPYIKSSVYNPVSHQVHEKRGSKALPIVDPTTKEQLDVSQIKGGASGNVSTTSEKPIDPKEEAIERFKSEFHRVAGTTSSITSSTEPRPNAIISNPNHDVNTEVINSITVITSVETTQTTKSDKTDDAKLTEETPPTTDLSETDTQSTQPETSGKSQPETQFSDFPSTEIISQTPPIEVTPSTQGDTTSEVVTTGHDMDRHVVVSQSDTKPSQPSPEPVILSSVSPNSHPIDPLPLEPSKDSSIETIKSDTLVKELTDSNIEQITQVSIEDKQPDSLPSSTKETDKLSDLEDENTEKQSKPDTSPDLDRSTDNKAQDSELTSLTSSEAFQESDIDRIEEVAMETEEEEEEKEEEMIMNGDVHVEESIGFLKDHQGRFIYDRKFLLQFKDKNIEPPKQLSQYSDVYRPQSGGNAAGPRRDSRNVRPTRKIDYNPSKEEKVELRKAENRWTRSEKISGDVSTSEETEEVFRKFQGILNKLTPQKFKDLAERARELNINTEERLRGCIDKIFSKALEEPNFSVAYAHLCRVLSYIKVEIVKTDESGEETKKETSFRRELLTRCQKEFEKDKKDDETREEKLKAIEEATSEEEKKLKKERLVEWEDTSRKRSLGNIRFIGELFKLKMLSESIMHECIVRLLRSTSDEEALECFGRLITTTGKELDHPQAKQRMDRYFERIADIIEKKKISSRIRFMLQDVQEMRKNEWVARRQETLKTIDQIHMEAEMEAIQEKEMIRSLQPLSSKQFPKEEKRRGNKSGQDDYSSRKGEKTGGRRDSTPDVTRITALSNRKEKEKAITSLGPGVLRPGGWKRPQAPTPPPSSDSKTEKERVLQPKGGQQRSSSSSKRQVPPPGGRNSQQGLRRSTTQPDERAELLKTVKDFAQPAVSSQPKKPVDKLDEATIERKTPTIVDELVQNKDFKEAVECVSEMESPCLLHVFVREAVNHSLEKTSQTRVLVGTLFSVLLKDNILPEERLTMGLQEVLEVVDDLEVDIPKIWDFFAEIVTPALSDALSLGTFAKLLKDANLGNKAAKSMARTLKQCEQTTSKEKTLSAWQTSNLQWTDLGLQEKEIEEFLQRENLSFLLESSSSNPLPVGPGVPPDDPPYLKDLTVMFGSRGCSNDDIFEWIEKTIASEERKSAQFIKALTRAAVKGSTSGEGNQCFYEEKTFENRLNILKVYADENVKLQIEVLNGVQVGVALLKHPPNVLYKMFHTLYDVEVVSEQACFEWREKGSENYGRGVALISAKNFLCWLETAETESDSENYS